MDYSELTRISGFLALSGLVSKKKLLFEVGTKLIPNIDCFWPLVRSFSGLSLSGLILGV